MKSKNHIRSSKTRQRISLLLREGGAVISTQEAAKILDVSASQASMMLSKWTQQGWLKRLKRGFYAPIPIASRSSEQVLENVWVLVPKLFDCAYIAGWSAAEYWGLTEQIFQDICVITTKKPRKRYAKLQQLSFYLKHRTLDHFFGLKIIWHQNTKIQVSDPHKTIVDMLDDPSLGGGIHHVENCLRAYLNSELYDMERLIKYAKKQKNGTIFKRLGYLVSVLDKKKVNLIEECRKHMTQGISSLDPGYKSIRFVTEWRLGVPKNWQEER